MEDFESKISQILSDPGAMANILSMAKGLGLVPPPSNDRPGAGPAAPPETPSAVPPEPQQEQAPPENPGGPPPGDLPFSIMNFLSEAGKVDKKQVALFNALKPYLKPARREKIDRAIRIAQISHMAGYAIKNLEQK